MLSVGGEADAADVGGVRRRRAARRRAGAARVAEDVDLAEAITAYNSQEIAYRAAMQTAADVLKLNIMDYLR